MRGLFTKIISETWVATLLFGVALAAVLMLLTFVLPQIYESLGDILSRIPIARALISSLLGSEFGGEINARAMQAFLWVHPVVLSLVWAHEITLATRFPAGEIDRGTIDVLLSLPVSRRAVYLSETIGWLLSGAVLLAFGLLGHLTMAPTMPPELRPALTRVFLVLVNLYCVYLAVGGIAFLISSVSNRRGRAVFMTFGVVLASFLLNFLANFWPPAQNVSCLGVLYYYQPAQILQHGTFPARNISTLLAVGAIAWILGCEFFIRRSITTV